MPTGVSIGSLTPTPISVLEHMVKASWLSDGDLLYDLGCGDGRVVFEAAKLKRVRAGAGSQHTHAWLAPHACLARPKCIVIAAVDEGDHTVPPRRV